MTPVWVLQTLRSKYNLLEVEVVKALLKTLLQAIVASWIVMIVVGEDFDLDDDLGFKCFTTLLVMLNSPSPRLETQALASW